MKITPVNYNTTNFGYNKRLNKEFVQRLQNNPTPINNALFEMNEACNNLEDTIRELEGPNRRNLNKNRKQINVLLDLFMDVKCNLVSSADKYFPELNFLERERSSYHREAEKLPVVRSKDGDDFKYSNIWRETLVDNLYTIEEAEEDKDSSLELTSEHQQVQAHSNSSEDTLSETSSLVEKFTPYSHSPKSLDDVVGLNGIVDDIKDLIMFPLEKPNAASLREEEYGIEIPHFIVFYGPPGCGKTMLSEAIAAETGCDMYKMDISKIGSSYVNGSAINIGKAFDYLSNISKNSEKPVLLFMDEMDSLLTKRSGSDTDGGESSKAVNTLLQQIVAAKDNNIIIIGATNVYDLIDPAVKDRAKIKVYIGLPNDKERAVLLNKRLNRFEKGQNLASNEEELMRVSKELKEFSPRSIVGIVEDASLRAYRAGREVIAQDLIDASKGPDKQKINEKEYKPKDKAVKIGF